MNKIVSEMKNNWSDMESSLKENNAQELTPLFVDYTNEIIRIIRDRKEELNNEYLSKLKQLKNEGDHDEADWLLCQLLKELGFSEIVEVYLKLPKWYS